MEQAGKTHVLALDLEGTLISNALSQIPRPGLRAFLEYCSGAFPRIVIYTFISEERFRGIARMLIEDGSAPDWFASLEHIEWDGTVKDLRRIPGADPARTFIVDDHEPYIQPEQRRQWVRIRPFEAPYPDDDSELSRIRRVLDRIAAAGEGS